MVTVTQIQHQVNPGFNVAIVKDGHIMHAALLTWSIFAKTVSKTIKIEQYLNEIKTLHHFLDFYFSLFFVCASLFIVLFLLFFVQLCF